MVPQLLVLKKNKQKIVFFFTGRFLERNVLQGKHRQYDDWLSSFILNNKTENIFIKI